MEIKKSKEANLESKRSVFFFVGLVMIASIVLMAFQYNTTDIAAKYQADEENSSLGDDIPDDYVEEEEIEEEEIEEEPPTSAHRA